MTASLDRPRLRQARTLDLLRPELRALRRSDPSPATHLDALLHPVHPADPTTAETSAGSALERHDQLQVAHLCAALADDPVMAAAYTAQRRKVAIVTDGSAMLGLGSVGPRAALPLMEVKASIFRRCAGLDAVPICLESGTVEEMVDTITRLAPAYAGITLEDISSPRCFEIERRLSERLDVPVMHADQHGTAVAALAGLYNAARVVGKRLEDLRVVIAGAAAAGTATAHLLIAAGIRDVVVGDIRGIVCPRRDDLEEHHHRLAARTNPRGLRGPLAQAFEDADVFLGLSGARMPERHIAAMAPRSIVFALANPRPEVDPELAARHVEVYATGRSDLPNQMNNSLVFPGVFRGALDHGVQQITMPMKLAAARAIADLVPEPTAQHILPAIGDERLVPAVAAAVARHGSDPTHPIRPHLR